MPDFKGFVPEEQNEFGFLKQQCQVKAEQC